MLDRVVMDVIDMPGIIGLITNLMLPETPLPQGDLSALMPRCRLPCRLGDLALDQAPAYRVLGVLGG